jgi:hypothetical protein
MNRSMLLANSEEGSVTMASIPAGISERAAAISSPEVTSTTSSSTERLGSLGQINQTLNRTAVLRLCSTSSRSASGTMARVYSSCLGILPPLLTPVRLAAGCQSGDKNTARAALSMLISHIEVEPGNPLQVTVHYPCPGFDRGVDLMPPRRFELLFQP